MWTSRLFLLRSSQGRRAILTEVNEPRAGKDLYRVEDSSTGTWYDFCSVSALHMSSPESVGYFLIESGKSFPLALRVRASWGETSWVATRQSADTYPAPREALADLAQQLRGHGIVAQMGKPEERLVAWLSALQKAQPDDNPGTLLPFRALLDLLATADEGVARALVEEPRWVEVQGFDPRHGVKGARITSEKGLSIVRGFRGIDAADPLRGAAELMDRCGNR
jgi:hypothetical protein